MRWCSWDSNPDRLTLGPKLFLLYVLPSFQNVFPHLQNQSEGQDILMETERALPKVKQWQSRMKQAPARTSRQANHPLSTRFQFPIITECKSVFKKLIFFTNKYDSCLCCFILTDAQSPCSQSQKKQFWLSSSLADFCLARVLVQDQQTPSLELQQWQFLLQPDLPQMQHCICY